MIIATPLVGLVGVSAVSAAGAAGTFRAEAVADAAAGTLNVSGVWSVTYACASGWCAGQSFPDTYTLAQLTGSSAVTGTTSAGGTLTGTVTGNSLLLAGVEGGYTWHLVLTVSADGDSYTGTASDSNGSSGTDTGTRPSPPSPTPTLATPTPSPSPALGTATGPRSSSPPPVKRPAPGGQVSSISASLPTPASAFSPLSSDLGSLALTVVAALLITFPASLFNSTFEENYADISAWWAKWLAILFPERFRRRTREAWRTATHQGGKDRITAEAADGKNAERKDETGSKRRWAGFSLVLLVGALMGALLDPSFGANVRTLISYVAIVIAMITGVVISGLVTGAYHRARRHGRVSFKPEALPAGLAIAAACVLVSRSTGFEPGYLYGVICGVAFGRKLEEHEEGHVVAIGSLARVFLAIVAWIGWDAIHASATASGSFFGMVLVDDFLASLFVSSLVSTVISLFPLRFLPGHKLQAWHRGIWAATFLVSLFVLVQVLLRPHGGRGPSDTPLVTTLVLFGLFAVGSVLFREHFVRKRRHEMELADQPAS